VEARIVVWRAPSVLTVPASALFQRGDRWHVFAVEGGRVRLRAVDVGHRGGASVEVVRGLAEGATVVLFPSDKLVEGMRVK
jgi:HlyD family secretion protein